MITDVVIIGAGAAGLMCAIEAAKRGRRVVLLEKSDKVGKKILISGGGRCNFTNLYTSADNFHSANPHFCKSALSRYTQWDFIALLEKHGLSWTEKTLGQLFCDQKSKAVVEMLIEECLQAGVDIQLNCSVESIVKDDQFGVSTHLDQYQCDSLVIATGGPSIPKMGATDFALSVARQFSLRTIDFVPALVPFTFSQDFMDRFICNLSGVSTFVDMCSADDTCFKEAILFTHKGISGPAALQVSSYWRPGETIYINLFPQHDLLPWLQEQQKQHPDSELKTVLAYQLPKRLAAKLCDTMLTNKPMKQFADAELQTLVTQLSEWQLHPTGTQGMRIAEVSAGGVDTSELSSKTFETTTVDGLYFIGEGVDVTGHLGGFNFQWAWSSGWCAGHYV